MFPKLFHFGDFSLDSFAVFMTLGYVAAFFWVRYATRKIPEQRQHVLDLFVLLVVSSLLGGKWGHVLFEAESHDFVHSKGFSAVLELLKKDPFHPFDIASPGFVWYGGLILALLFAWLYFRRGRISHPWALADRFAPAVALGGGIGRIGCFFAGCCYGDEVHPGHEFIGVHFPKVAGLVYPTQLFESFMFFLIFIVLVWRQKYTQIEGEIVAWLLLLYAPARFMLEYFRGDGERGMIGLLSSSQFISIPMFLVGLFILFIRRQKHA